MSKHTQYTYWSKVFLSGTCKLFLQVCVCASVSYLCVNSVKWLLQYIGHGQEVCDHTESSSRRSTPPYFTGFRGRSLIFCARFSFIFIFLLLVPALILDQPGLLLDRKCFMLVKIIALSFPTHKIAFVSRWGMHLRRQSLSRQSDGNGFN